MAFAFDVHKLHGGPFLLMSEGRKEERKERRQAGRKEGREGGRE